jgi:hypothetical protein
LASTHRPIFASWLKRNQRARKIASSSPLSVPRSRAKARQRSCCAFWSLRMTEMLRRRVPASDQSAAFKSEARAAPNASSACFGSPSEARAMAASLVRYDLALSSNAGGRVAQPSVENDRKSEMASELASRLNDSALERSPT